MDRRLTALVVAILVATGCGGNAARPTSSQSSGPHPSPSSDRLVHFAGRSLYLECHGSGSPTAVLEAGLGGDHQTWRRVLRALPQTVRVCAYDRANIPPSSAPTPGTAMDVAVDLHGLLNASGEKPPYVLVGFSFGGLTTQLYAASYPQDIAGLVLVESNHPEEVRQFEAHLTPDQIAEDRAQSAQNPEEIDLYKSFDQVRAAPALPHVPLVVVSSGRPGDWPPGWDPKLFDRLRAQQQADLAHRVPGGTQLIAGRSDHAVPQKQPETVVQAIQAVLARIR
ncbi:MAG: alpha/beta hydrolase [bacterium]